MSHDHTLDGAALLTQEFWDARYGSTDQIWSGNPNPQLVEQVADLAPGTALDVGSGEGADAISQSLSRQMTGRLSSPRRRSVGCSIPTDDRSRSATRN